jgi:hypothetical protein
MLSEESRAMNRTSVLHRDSQPRPETAMPRAVIAREAGLELIRRINRWLIAAAVAAAGMFSLLAAHALHGHTVAVGASSNTAAGAGSSSGAPQSNSSASGSGLQAPTQIPAPAPAAPAPVISGGS